MLDDPSREAATGRPRAGTIAGAVTESMLHHDLPDASATEVSAAIRHVDECITAMPDIIGFGVRLMSGPMYAMLSLRAGAPFERVSIERRADVARAIARRRVPLVGEYFRLTRGLGLVGAFEARSAMEPAEV